MVYGCQKDNRPKRVARGMQGGLINIWRFSRVCNVFTLSKVKSQRAIALGKFHSIDIVGATTGTWNTGESTEGVASGPSRAQPSYIELAFFPSLRYGRSAAPCHWRYRLIKVFFPRRARTICFAVRERPLVYGQNDAARCSFRSKSQVKALLHPYGTAMAWFLVDPIFAHRNPQTVAAGPDERGWRAEKCWERRENFGAQCCLAVLYAV